MSGINKTKNISSYITGNFYLWPGLFSVFVVGAILCAYGFWMPGHEARAFTTKSTNQGLAPGEWNSLPNDFVDKAGDTMGGNLSLGGRRVVNLPDPAAGADAANRQWVEGEIASVFGGAVGGEARDVSGTIHLGIACGSTPVATNWAVYPTTSAGAYISTYVNTSGAGFGAAPYYFTAIRGSDRPWDTIGPNSIVSPLPSGFRVVLRTDVTAAQAMANNWRIDWCGVGN